jgi:hypothetical protein
MLVKLQTVQSADKRVCRLLAQCCVINSNSRVRHKELCLHRSGYHQAGEYHATCTNMLENAYYNTRSTTAKETNIRHTFNSYIYIYINIIIFSTLIFEHFIQASLPKKIQ